MKLTKITVLLFLLWGIFTSLEGQELSLIEIDESEITLELDRIIQQNKMNGKEITVEEIPTLRENIKEGIIMRKLLLSLADYREITIPSYERDSLITSIKNEYSQEEWETLLLQQGYTEESFIKIMEESLLIDRVLEKEVLNNISISDREAEEYYKENPEAFTTDHGLIPFEDVSELIKQNLLALKGQQEISLFMEKLYAKAMFVEKE